MPQSKVDYLIDLVTALDKKVTWLMDWAHGNNADAEFDENYGDDQGYLTETFDEDYEEQPIGPGMPRRYVTVKDTVNGGEERVDWNDIPRIMQEAITISNRDGYEWQVYRDASGNLRIMTDHRVSTELHRMYPDG